MLMAVGRKKNVANMTLKGKGQACCCVIYLTLNPALKPQYSFGRSDTIFHQSKSTTLTLQTSENNIKPT